MPDFYTILDKQKGLITVTCRSQPVGPGALHRALCAEPLNCDDGAIFGTDLVARTRAALAKSEPEALSPKEVEAQEAFTQLRDEILCLSDGLEVNEVLRIIDDHTPKWV